MSDRGQKILSNTRYFDGKAKLMEWQDKYTSSMQQRFKCLNRGIRHSKAKHMAVRQFYNIVEQTKTVEDKQIVFKSNLLLKNKVKGIENTLLAYKSALEKSEKTLKEKDLFIKQLQEQIKEIKVDKDLYKEVIKEMSLEYKLPQNAIKNVFDMIRKKEKEKDKEFER